MSISGAGSHQPVEGYYDLDPGMCVDPGGTAAEETVPPELQGPTSSGDLGQLAQGVTGVLLRQYLDATLPAAGREVEGLTWSQAKDIARQEGGVHAVLMGGEDQPSRIERDAGTLTDALRTVSQLASREAAGQGNAALILSNGSTVDIRPDGSAALTSDFRSENLSPNDLRFLRHLRQLELLPAPSDPALARATAPSARGTNIPPGEGTTPLPPEPAALEVRVGDTDQTYGDIYRMGDPVARNEVINDTYHRLANDMRDYLGAGDVATWATYGVWASREAGEGIYAVGEALAAFDEIDELLDSSNPLAAGINAGQAAARLWDLASHTFENGAVGQMMEQGLRLACSEAGLDFDRIKNGDGSLGDVYRLARAMPTLVSDLRQTMREVHSVLAGGNAQILANAGPAHEAFLNAERAGQDGIQALRDAGFSEERYPELVGAFRCYQQAARSEDQGEKRRLIEEGNLLFVQHEQAIVAQPYFNQVSDAIRASTPVTELHIPDSNGQLRGVPLSRDVPGYPGSASNDWSDYGQRIRTIAAFFQSNFENPELFRAPPPIRH